ncbi:translocase subunit seca [Rhynchospora pubera]|uniref:Translocase subunit seca n=1 Tax=Rhynchospora pubera TaxID=906938 RepID=A0AAV8G5T5_9POAL|nr:translocase subunit seca [Rhynchospora pubera]
MEHCSMRLNNFAQTMPRSDFVSDKRSRFWQIEGQSAPKSEVICPQPCRISRVPLFIETLNRSSPKPSSLLSMCKVDGPHDIIDIINNKSDLEFDDLTGNTGFFCGSPPVRTNNPLVKDAQFLNQINSQSPVVLSPLGTDLSGKKPTGVPTFNSTYGSSPKVRIEGFNCRASVPTFA